MQDSGSTSSLSHYDCSLASATLIGLEPHDLSKIGQVWAGPSEMNQLTIVAR